MKKLFLGLLIVPLATNAMDKDEAFKALAQKLIDQKVEAYRKTVAQEFEQLKIRVAAYAQSEANTSTTNETHNKKSVTVPHELIAKEEYAPLLEHFIANKEIDPSFSWREDFSRMMMPCSSRYTLLGVALQCKAISNAKILIEHGANLEDYCNPINRSYTSILYPLPESVRLNNPELVKAVLSKKKNVESKGKNVTDFPLTIALERMCSEQDISEKNKAWEIVQTLVAAGCDPLEESHQCFGVFVRISDGTKTYTISPIRPIDVVSEYNRLFGPKLADLETFLRFKRIEVKLSGDCTEVEQASNL